MSNYKNPYIYTDKQLQYSNRTFDIVPVTVAPRNLNLERGLFNQDSDIEYKNPVKQDDIKNTINSNSLNHYKNPYVISQTDFTDNSMSRKVDKRNRTNIYNQRLNATSNYINQMKTTNNASYSDRFYQMDQKNPNPDKFKNTKSADKLSFQEYLDFKRKMAQHQGTPKY